MVLPAYLVKHGLGVQSFHVTDAAVHEQPYDALGPRRKMRLAIGRPIASGDSALASRWSIAARARPPNPSALEPSRLRLKKALGPCSFVASPQGHKVVVIQQSPRQKFLWSAILIIAQLAPLRHCLEAGGALGFTGTMPKITRNALSTNCHHQLLDLAAIAGKALCDGLGGIEDQLAIGQRQSLLRLRCSVRADNIL